MPSAGPDVAYQSPAPQPAAPEAKHGKRVYLSLGSNLGDRVANLRQALKMLGQAGIEVERVSSFYKTEPVDFRPQPWFVNCVAQAVTYGIERHDYDGDRQPGKHSGPRRCDELVAPVGDHVAPARHRRPHADAKK